MKKVLIIGGYGNFGSFISRNLASDPNISLIIGGRSPEKGKALISEINPANSSRTVELDITKNLQEVLQEIKPHIVIHTSGPFQRQGYDVARACLDQGCHYIDLADGREFVEGITTLDEDAKKQEVLVVSGASSVPCLTSALVDHYHDEFETLESLDYGITTAQQTARGLATTAAILTYTGKPISTLINGKMQKVYGWQHIHARKYKNLGYRLLGNCDVPDLALFPARYGSLKSIRFYAGLELPFIHITLWVFSWLVRAGIIKNLEKTAPLLLKMAGWFDWLGSSDSAFHMVMSGKDHENKDKQITFELTARSGDGPYIPCMPAILLAKKLAVGELQKGGAYPCVGLITKDEYLNALKGLDIGWQVFS
ncbi:MAG: potassium transporter [Alphaproteobacteria bacterium]|nr:potassium transporter [Alphaproteobacteria bacterium]